MICAIDSLHISKNSCGAGILPAERDSLLEMSITHNFDIFKNDAHESLSAYEKKLITESKREDNFAKPHQLFL